MLNEKGDRAFQGTMKVLIALGTAGQASTVKVVGGTLNSPEVATCLVETISRFEFPKLRSARRGPVRVPVPPGLLIDDGDVNAVP